MTVYEALYNYMTEESAFATLSVHKTEKGARDAVAKELRKEREEFNKRYNYDRDEMPYFYGDFQAWGVDKVEVLD